MTPPFPCFNVIAHFRGISQFIAPKKSNCYRECWLLARECRETAVKYHQLFEGSATLKSLRIIVIWYESTDEGLWGGGDSALRHAIMVGNLSHFMLAGSFQTISCLARAHSPWKSIRVGVKLVLRRYQNECFAVFFVRILMKNKSQIFSCISLISFLCLSLAFYFTS